MLALNLVLLHGPDDQKIELNPESVVSLRVPRPTEGTYFAMGIKCLIHTYDGKFITVHETCDEVREILLKNGVRR